MVLCVFCHIQGLLKLDKFWINVQSYLWLPLESYFHQKSSHKSTLLIIHYNFSPVATEWCCCWASCGLSTPTLTARSPRPPSWASSAWPSPSRPPPCTRSGWRQTCSSRGFLLTSKSLTAKRSKWIFWFYFRIFYTMIVGWRTSWTTRRMISPGSPSMAWSTPRTPTRSSRPTMTVSLIELGGRHLQLLSTSNCVFISVINKGQVMSTYFRLLNRRGGYTWMQMCATLVCNTKNDQEQSIICVNYVLSGSQYSHVIMDKAQVDQPGSRVKTDTEEAIGSGQETVSGSPDSCRGERGIMTLALKLICEGGSWSADSGDTCFLLHVVTGH